jgi:hypothetical protein
MHKHPSRLCRSREKACRKVKFSTGCCALENLIGTITVSYQLRRSFRECKSMSNFYSGDGSAPRFSAGIGWLVVLMICASCDLVGAERIDEIEKAVEAVCPPTPPEGEVSYLPLREGAKWVYDYRHDYVERDGSLKKELTVGTLTMDVTLVQCTDAGVTTFTIQERIVAEKTDSVFVGWCCVENPDTVVTHGTVDTQRTLQGSLQDEWLLLQGYTRAPDASGYHVVPYVMWHHPGSEPDTVTVGGLMSAGFGTFDYAHVSMVREIGMSYWSKERNSTRADVPTYKTTLILREIEP